MGRSNHSRSERSERSEFVLTNRGKKVLCKPARPPVTLFSASHNSQVPEPIFVISGSFESRWNVDEAERINFSNFEFFRSLIDRFFDRFWSTCRIFVDFSRNLGYGGLRGRWIEWRYWFFGKIDIYGRNGRFDCRKLIAFGRLFDSLSIFDQTWDMGVFGGAESNGAIRFSWKSIFLVESIDSTAPNWSLLVDFSSLCRFLTKPRIWGFSRALKWMAVFV